MSPAPDRNSLRLLRAIYEKTGGRSRGVRDVTELETGLTADAARTAWRNLLALRLIERFSTEYAARLSVEGLDFIQSAPPPEQTAPVELRCAGSRKVFLAHGHGTPARDAVAEFIQELDLELILLEEQAAAGRTTMEQVEAHGEVGFAILLLTVEDLRPSLNVMMELGYLIGRFGRTRVCALVVHAPPDLPADLAGVALGGFDPSGDWRALLSSHLQAEGLT
ncbi:MAG TPA: TIR domain-containing protein [Bryobacteraceae bacterium]|jgi:hypothetical protein